MEPFRRQLATGQTSVMDWDIILYICFRLNSFFVCGESVRLLRAEEMAEWG